MKKLLLLALAIPFAYMGNAQTTKNGKNIYKVSPVEPYIMKKRSDRSDNSKLVKKPNPTAHARGNKNFYQEELLDNTFYDLQTNSSIQGRILRNSTDSTLSMVWTESRESGGPFSDRGTGYAHLDEKDTTWTKPAPGAFQRIESERSGWPSILYPQSGGEIIISHTADAAGNADNNLLLNSRPTVGSGAWTEKRISTTDLTWNRAAMGGADGNTIHMVAVTDEKDSLTFQGLRTALVYYRSTDGGSTFDITDMILPGMGSADVGPIGGDSYAIIARGDTVVIAVFDTWNDIFIMKSFDNGNNWTKTVIFNHPYAKTDIVTDLVNDTVESPDGSGAILMDNNGLVHVFWGWIGAVNDVIEVAPTDPVWTFFSNRNGLVYWNENMAANQFDTIAGAIDYNNDGLIQPNAGLPNYGTGITSFPSPALDTNGDIYLVYAGVHELFGDADGNYRHLYIIKSTDNGATWSDPHDIVPNEEFTENMFASMYPVVDGEYLHIIYQRDGDPGVHLRDAPAGPQPVTDNEILYARIDKRLRVGIESYFENLSKVLIAPNPAKDQVTINFDLKKPGQVQLELVNLMGQKVFSAQHSVNNASQNKITMDVNRFKSGVYFVNIIPETGKPVSNKLIIR